MYQQFKDEIFLGAFRKIANSDYWLPHVCLVHLRAENKPTPTKQIVMRFDICFPQTSLENSRFIKI